MCRFLLSAFLLVLTGALSACSTPDESGAVRGDSPPAQTVSDSLGGEAEEAGREERDAQDEYPTAETVIAQWGPGQPGLTVEAVKAYEGVARRDDCYSTGGRLEQEACFAVQFDLLLSELGRAREAQRQRWSAEAGSIFFSYDKWQVVTAYAHERWWEGLQADCTGLALEVAGGTQAGHVLVECMVRGVQERLDFTRPTGSVPM